MRPLTVKTNPLLLQAARGERTKRTPVWLMRQAGRFDPAYLALRERCGLPLEEMFRRADLAAEITLLPRRFGVDALIIFQDILTPLAPMGAPFVFRPGPVLEQPVASAADVERLRRFDPRAELEVVTDAIGLVRDALDRALPLLGFAGAPLTLAAFILEGGSPAGRLERTRAMMESDPRTLHRLLEKLAVMTVDYLRLQIAAGVDAVQLFESVADLLTGAEYEAYAQPYQTEVLSKLADTVPRILFAKEMPRLDLMVRTGADVLSVGNCIDVAEARREYGDVVAIQGNVDNMLLAEGAPEEIDRAAVRRCLEAGRHHGHILNLSHGLLRQTPPDNVRLLIDICRSYRCAEET